jgi:hypothetical protein
MALPTLAEVKTHLDETTVEHDAQLQGFLDAAVGMVEDWSTEALSVEPEVVSVFGGQVMLSAYPVTGVTAIETVDSATYAGTAVSDLSVYPVTNAKAGFVRAPHSNGTLLRVTYTVDTTASAQFRLAVLEVVAHLWRGRKGGSETYLPAGEPDVAGSPLLGGLKRRVELILGDRADTRVHIA